MCGITGFLDISCGKKKSELEDIVTRMADTLHHRGPDDNGLWTDEKFGIALGHKRLSIIDLSREGRQPMVSACGRYVVVFNGEIYNFKILRRELEDSGYAFRSHSDTEVMLGVISRCGVEGAARKLNGMFAFAVWDREGRTLSIARDRMGEKPLYYGRSGNAFLFASELKAIRAYPELNREIDRDAIALYMRYNCVPAPYSIYKNIHKLPPASILNIDISSSGNIKETISVYWSLADAVKKGRECGFDGSIENAVEYANGLLGDAVRLRMESDVPLGVFLSGGIDSSLVAALMQSQSTRPVKTFTIGFNESRYNEAAHAKSVAGYLGTEHTEFYVTAADAMAVIPRLPDIYDEPFSDSSQIPTFLVSELTRKKVTVSLSGDGGDEVFGGYKRYFWVNDIWRNIGWINESVKKRIACLLMAVPPERWEKVFSDLGNILPTRARQRTPGDKIHKLADILSASGPYDMYTGLVSHWKETGALVLNSEEPLTIITDRNKRMPELGLTEEMMYKDAVSYLPDDILVKVDRASMAVSLESRAPFLDHRVVEFAWQLPLDMKVRKGEGKRLLKKLLYRYIPPKLVERPKMGFALPIDKWLRGPLKEWALSLLDPDKIRREGFLNPLPIMEKWKEHASGRRSWQHLLWDILMFEAWYERWK